MRESFCVSKNFWYRRNLSIGKGYQVFAKLFSRSTGNFQRRNFWFSEFLGHRKLLDKNGGYHRFPSTVFRLNVLKRLVSEPLRVSGNIWYRSNLIVERRDIITFSQRFLSHSAEKNSEGTLLCFKNFWCRKFFMDKKGEVSTFSIQKISIPDNFGETEALHYEDFLFWSNETKKIVKAVMIPFLCMKSLDTRKFLIYKKVPSQNFSAHCIKKYSTEIGVTPPLTQKNFDTRKFLIYRRMRLWSFPVLREKYSPKVDTSPFLSIKNFQYRELFETQKCSLSKIFYTVRQKTLTESDVIPPLNYEIWLIPDICRDTQGFTQYLFQHTESKTFWPKNVKPSPRQIL